MENKYRTDVIRLKTKHIRLVSHMHSDYFFFFSFHYFIEHRMYWTAQGVQQHQTILVTGINWFFLSQNIWNIFQLHSIDRAVESNLLLLINDLTLFCVWMIVLASNVCYIPNSILTVEHWLWARDLPAVRYVENNDNSYFRFTTCCPNWIHSRTHFFFFQYLSIRKKTFFFSLLLAYDLALHRNNHIGS